MEHVLQQDLTNDADSLSEYLFDATLDAEECAYAESVEASLATPVSPPLRHWPVGDRSTARTAGARFATGLAVLVVDDTPVRQATAVRMLANCGLRADVAPDGETAVALIAERTYAAVLIDCDVPAPDGLATVQKIRRRELAGARVVIVATTGCLTQENRSRCLAAGVDDLLSWPLRNQPLAETLGWWITPSPVLLEENVVAELEGLDGNLLDTLLTLYFAETAHLLGELATAIGRGETVAVRQGAHKLRGSSCAVGAAQVAQLYAELEAAAAKGDLTVADGLLDPLRIALRDTRAAFDRRGATARATPARRRTDSRLHRQAPAQ